MISKKQMKILEVLKNNLDRGVSFNELKNLSKLKSHNFLQSSINKFSKEGIIKQNKIGSSKVYALKVFPKAVHYLPLLSFEEYDVPEEIIDAIVKEL